MRIGFLYPSWTKAYGISSYFAKRNSSWPPLNLALLAAVVKSKGHDAFIVDGAIEEMDVDTLVNAALAQQPDIIGLTSFSPFFHIQVEVAKALKLKAPDLPIIIGGSHATIVKEKALLDCFDYVFVGEAEDSFPRFLDALEQKKNLVGIAGLVFRGEDGPLSTGVAEFRDNFDDLPFPDRELLDNTKYLLGTMQGRKRFTLIQTTRGCPWKCIFCSSKELNTTRILRRSPESVVAEMKHVVEKYGIEHIFFVDDVLTLHDEHVLAICDLIEKENLKVTWESSTRANLLTEDSIKRMAECGLIRLSLGLEAVDPEIRRTMNKKVPLKYYTESNRLMNKYGVEVLNSVMIGLPGETEETVRSLLTFLGKSRDIMQANLAIAVPYPGTEFHEMAINGQNGIKLHSDDFSEYRRYGTAVTSIGDLSPEDLVELQNEGFVKIYAAPWRWKPMYGKHGIIGILLTLLRVVRLVKWKTKRAALKLVGITRKKTEKIAVGHTGTPKNPNG